MKSKKLSEKILRSIKSKGFKSINLNPVLEAKYILQRSGESFKKFLFSFFDLNGKELCLRPDLTISSVLRFIQNKGNKKEKVCYAGQAFRKTYTKKESIIKNQIGFEILGSNNKLMDDKEILDISLKILKNSSFKKSVLKLGNVEIFNLLIDKLDIPNRWKNRLKRYYWNESYFNELLKRLETNSDIDPVFVEIDKSRYLKMRKDNQNKILAGRSYKEILDRFDTKIKDPRRSSTGKKNTKIIKEFLKIKCPIGKATNVLNSFFRKNNINIDMVIQNTSLDGKKANITFTVKREDLKKTLGLIEKNKEKLNYNKITQDDKLAKISIIGAGMQANAGVTHKMFRSLADEKINILAISTSEIKISVLIREDLTQKAVKALHKTFGLN